ncbi:cob(I)yrinic acid a,c-diamide adenosyltransferase [Oerskovia flava]|uniref:cob(I)yrinic acid a,c-diamide adenosyltransferase n=1 Tax=Oerskovia flava TaxID=2986422 RepID=UPI002240361E|nr:cob(I)yrinic acid a,c-diamide adenosyltransferase [Oerskovia sp. JB1-3-2]
MVGRSARPRPANGIVMLFCGEGWGKSAAAVGYAVRARGSGWPTTVVQFLKGGAWNAAEISRAADLGIDWPVLSPDLTWGGLDTAQVAADAWDRARDVLGRPGPSLLVLDELTHALDGGWLDLDDVVATLRSRAPGTSVVITGRTAPDELVDLADTVTRFELVKHDGKRGILAP